MSQTQKELEDRMAIERKVIRHLIRAMKKAGWDIVRINDGGESDEDTLTPNETEAMDTVFSVDESTIYFRKENPFTGQQLRGQTHFASIILGNDGYDCIADHSCSNPAVPWDDYEAIMGEVYKYCETLAD